MFVTPTEQARLSAALDTCRRHLARVRAERPEWYVWVTEGQPILTPEQYAELATHRARKRKSP